MSPRDNEQRRCGDEVGCGGELPRRQDLLEGIFSLCKELSGGESVVRKVRKT